MGQIPFWQYNSRSVGQEVPRLLWNSKIHCRVHKSSPHPHTLFKILCGTYYLRITIIIYYYFLVSLGQSLCSFWGFQAVMLQVEVFWVVTQYNVAVGYQRFEPRLFLPNLITLWRKMQIMKLLYVIPSMLLLYITNEMLALTWRETEYRLDVCRCHWWCPYWHLLST
jgi:hypothetical protein